MYIEESVIGHIIMIGIICITCWISYKVVQSTAPKKEDKQ